jgi:hypothetical protein
MLLDCCMVKVSASRSNAVGNDLVEGGLVGVQSTFTVFARDQFGNRLLAGGALWELLIYQPQVPKP